MSGQVLSMKAVSYKAGGHSILSNVNLIFRPGEIAAIIGPSGSGKSTLLKCLSTTYRPSSGLVRLDSQDILEIVEEYRQNLGYVPQEDIIHRELRVRAAFYYAARLRMDEALKDVEIEEKIKRLGALLGMSERMGHKISRLSGGQQKRVNIGIELLSDPSILILDEPASGLDPGTEEDLLRFLKTLAAENNTIVMTTHSMEYLSMVDRIVLLQSGWVIFAGKLGQLLKHFEIVHIADVFKRIRERKAEEWVKAYNSSPLAAAASA